MNGYMIFMKTNRRKIINDYYPNDTPKECFTKVAKKGGLLWNNLSEKEKNVYNNNAKLLPRKSKKSRQSRQSRKSRKSRKSKENSNEKNPSNKKSTKRKRKLSAYIKWFSQNRGKIIRDHGMSNLEGRELLTSVGKKAGEIWRSMSDVDKNKFK